MKIQFIEDIAHIKEGEWIEDVFLVKEKRISLRKDGTPYLILRIGDRTGTIDCKIWDNTETVKEKFAIDDFVRIRGIITNYQGTREINIKDIEKVEDDVVNVKDFIKASAFKTEDMVKALYAIISDIKNFHLRQLLTLFYEDDKFMKLFTSAPAAKEIHHAYIGGLLEHSIEVARLCIDAKRHFREIDIDLLITGALLHDIGKVKELKYRRSLDYTDEGRLIGHILLGVEMVEEKLRKIPDFPPELAMLVKHLIVSHQGSYEWGSPKVPQTLEAIILHYLDDLSAKVNIFRRAMEKDSGENGHFSSFNKALGRYLYKHKETEYPFPETPDKEDSSTGVQEKLF